MNGRDEKNQARWAKGDSVGRRLIAGLTEVAEALERGEELEERFTVRDMALDLEPKAYSSEGIKRLRARLGASQGVFAMLIGVRPSTVQSWEQGAPAPPIARRLFEVIEQDPEPWLARLRASSRASGSSNAA